MRGELPPALVAVGRGSGMAGLAAGGAGVAGIVAAGSPWHEAVAELTMLGAAEDRAVATLVGWVTIPGVAAGLAGMFAALLGIALAVDRHPGWARPGLLTSAVVMGLAGTLAQLRRPSLDRFPDEAGALGDLRAVVDDLPRGVELTLSVRAGVGPTIAIVAAAVIVVAVAAARDLDVR